MCSHTSAQTMQAQINVITDTARTVHAVVVAVDSLQMGAHTLGWLSAKACVGVSQRACSKDSPLQQMPDTSARRAANAAMLPFSLLPPPLAPLAAPAATVQ